MSKIYPKVEHDLLEMIRTKVWAIGEKLPTERRLAEQFGVSRSTMRNAMLLLENRGMISRSPRRGTILLADAPRQFYRQQIGALKQLDDFAASTTLHVIDFTSVHAQDMERAADTPWHWPETLVRYEGWRSFSSQEDRVSLTQVCYDKAFDGIRDRIGQEPTPTHRIIAEVYGVHVKVIEQDVSATALGEHGAHILRRDPAEAVLKINRVMLTQDDRVIMTTRSLHCANAVTLSMQIRG